jgi:DNA-binding NtrC family response regulator
MVLRTSEVQGRFFGEKSDPNMQFGCIAQKLMHYSGLQEVMRRKLKTRVSIMAAYPSTETAQESFRLHAVDYFVNPLRHGDLINSVKEALQQ